VRKVTCPYRHCRTVLRVNLPPDAPTAAQVPLLCAGCEQSFLCTVGTGLPLFLARVRLWVLGLPDLLVTVLFFACLYAGWRLWLIGGYPAVLVAVGIMVGFGVFHQDAISDVNFLIGLVIGTATITRLGADYLGHRHALGDVLPMMGMAVLLVLVLAWFGAPPAEWSPPLLPNTQYGNTEILTTEDDVEGAGL
jgi:hypothetical protein